MADPLRPRRQQPAARSPSQSISPLSPSPPFTPPLIPLSDGEDDDHLHHHRDNNNNQPAGSSRILSTVTSPSSPRRPLAAVVPAAPTSASSPSPPAPPSSSSPRASPRAPPTSITFADAPVPTAAARRLVDAQERPSDRPMTSQRGSHAAGATASPRQRGGSSISNTSNHPQHSTTTTTTPRDAADAQSEPHPPSSRPTPDLDALAPTSPPPRGGRAAPPGNIRLPPSPWSVAAASEHAVDDVSTDSVLVSPPPQPPNPRSPNAGRGGGGGGGGSSSSASHVSAYRTVGGLGSGSLQAGQPRAMSFKRKMTPASQHGSSVGGAGGGGGRSGLLARAAARRSFGAAASTGLGAALGRNFRRAKTLSVHQSGLVGVGGEDGDGDGGGGDDDRWAGTREAKPRIPSLLPKEAPPYSTPIPTVPFMVLCLVCFGEFSSSGVAGPFLFFQIADFGVDNEADVGFWAGIVASAFYLAQFLTSLLWASVAEKHGRRIVLLVSLLGNATSLVLFGMSTNLRMAICVRLAQGLFNGAVGVAKGAVRDLCDETNEGRAMGMLGFFWGMGGIVGPILGGLLEHPASKYPSLFGQSQYLRDNPYVLPCVAGASFTLLGAFLTLFVGENGGPREGAIALLPEKGDVERFTNQAASNLGSFGRSAGKRISGYLAGGRASTAAVSDLDLASTSAAAAGNAEASGSRGSRPMPRTFTQQVDEETGGPPSPIPSEDEGTVITHDRRSAYGGLAGAAGGWPNPRWMGAHRAAPPSRTRDRHYGVLGGGSAYGYDRASGVLSATGAPTEASASGMQRLAGHAAGVPTRASHVPSSYDDGSGAPGASGAALQTVGADDEAELLARARQPRLSFAQRFLLANDDAVFSITDLWVAAAAAGDEYVEGEDDEDDLFGYDYDDDADLPPRNERGTAANVGDEDEEDDGATNATSTADESAVERGFGYGDTPVDEEGGSFGPRYLPPLNFAQRKLSRGARSDAGASSHGGGPGRRPRSARSPSWGRVPTLYANTGVERPTSPMGFSAQSTGLLSPGLGAAGAASQSGYERVLAGIPESTRNSLHAGGGAATAAAQPALANQRRGRSASGATALRPGSHFSNATVAAAQSYEVGAAPPPPPDIWSQLPRVFIVQYGLMSFGSSTCEQVFLAFLVSPLASGGLELTAAHYAELISAMALCQIVFQFHFYPRVGPPQGQWSHLAMLRLGILLASCSYLLFPQLRVFLHPSTDALVMAAMVAFASVRWLANVCQFTAASILMNATCAPHLVPMANGLAQTTSSAARFVGPLVGGYLYAQVGAQGAFGFIAAMSAAALVHAFTIR